MISEIAEKIASGATVTVLTGAGVSAPSGVPTFRGEDGLWKNFRAEDLATAEAFEQDPEMVWEWYNWRRELIRKCEPNAAHRILAKWEKKYPNFSLITQNVDGLHKRAGSKNHILFHGSIWKMKCWDDCEESPDSWWDEKEYTDIPKCPHCGGLARPGVVWFGESIDRTVLNDSFEKTKCELFFSIGTSSLVFPAASLIHEAHMRGAQTVEINLEECAASSEVDLHLKGSADEVLEEIDRAIGE